MRETIFIKSTLPFQFEFYTGNLSSIIRYSDLNNMPYWYCSDSISEHINVKFLTMVTFFFAYDSKWMKA